MDLYTQNVQKLSLGGTFSYTLVNDPYYLKGTYGTCTRYIMYKVQVKGT